mgnify:CR=1 FL=1
MNPTIRLVNRNLTISLNPGFLVWQVMFPIVYIFVAGFAYTSLIAFAEAILPKLYGSSTIGIKKSVVDINALPFSRS